MVPYIITTDAIVVVIDGRSHTIFRTNAHYQQLITAIKAKDVDAVRRNVSLASAINSFGKGKVFVKNGVVWFNNAPVHSIVSTHIIRMMSEGFDVNPIVNFLDNLMSNPSNTAVDELYLFLENAKMPITPDGHFLAYKRVRNDYKDIYTGKFDNSPGLTVEMPRNQVDDRRYNTCSRGLHFCAESYLPHYGVGPGNSVVLVKINPADVVSIPSDYANAKGRCSKYVVISDVTDKVGTFTQAVYDDGSGNTPANDYDDYDPNDDGDYVDAVYHNGLKQDRNGLWRDATGRFASNS